MRIRPADLPMRSRVSTLLQFVRPGPIPRPRRRDLVPGRRMARPPEARTTPPSLRCRLRPGPEVGAVDEHAVQDDGELARERDLRLLRPAALRDGLRPVLQGRTLHRPRQDDVGGFIERGSHAVITYLRDPAGHISLAGLVAA